jgi:hypothetical protein
MAHRGRVKPNVFLEIELLLWRFDADVRCDIACLAKERPWKKAPPPAH